LQMLGELGKESVVADVLELCQLGALVAPTAATPAGT